MKMKATVWMALMFVPALFVLGCKKSEKAEKAETSSRTENVERACSPETDATSATLARITLASVALTNCLYKESDRAMEQYRQICNEISTLPPKDGEKCVKFLVRSVLSVPYELLDHDKRLRALDRMCDIMMNVSWSGIGIVDRWEMCILRLSRIRDAIEYARSETNNWVTRSFIAYESENLEGYSETYERELAYRVSSQVKPSELRDLVNEMSDKEYAAVKAKFETFLGRPIRTYEEIRQADVKRARQWDLESERIAAEQRKLEAIILNDRRTGRHDAWHVGDTTNLSETATRER